MTNPYVLATVVVVLVVVMVAMVVVIWEAVTAPLLDAQGHVIEDRYGRCGTAFKEGDPVPDDQRDGRWG